MSATSTHQPRDRADDEDIFELFRRVQHHPDFVFGTIFVRGDFADETVPAAFSPKWATDALAERGNAIIDDAGATPDVDDDADDDAPCVLREFTGGSEHVSFAEFAHHVVQERTVAEQIAHTMLSTGEPYEYNEDEPRFREVFTIIDEAALRRQREASERDAP
jgi:hypothetical protein